MKPEPVAWIENHKAGKNLNWERVDHSYADATPLYGPDLLESYLREKEQHALTIDVLEQTRRERDSEKERADRHMGAVQAYIDDATAMKVRAEKSESENKRLQDAWAKAAQMNDDQAMRIGKLESECAALRKDAERYRYIRKHLLLDWDSLKFPKGFEYSLEAEDVGLSMMMDEAIDAAIKEQP